MGGWGLKFGYEVLRKIKDRWGFILCKSYKTSTFLNSCTFRWCIRFFPLNIIYTTGDQTPEAIETQAKLTLRKVADTRSN